MTTWRDKYPTGFLSNGDETKAQTLYDALISTKKTSQPLSNYDHLTRDLPDACGIGVDCDEVYPNIFLGDMEAAKNIPYLTRIGITHVLNTAEGNNFGMVNTNSKYYRKANIKYMGLKLLDLPMTKINLHFQETADFIEDALKNGGKVLVHCLMGMSRSSTIVIAYLMIKEGFTAVEAVTKVRLHREIRPNEGFLRQLAELDNKLRRAREQGVCM